MDTLRELFSRAELKFKKYYLSPEKRYYQESSVVEHYDFLGNEVIEFEGILNDNPRNDMQYAIRKIIGEPNTIYQIADAELKAYRGVSSTNLFVEILGMYFEYLSEQKIQYIFIRKRYPYNLSDACILSLDMRDKIISKLYSIQLAMSELNTFHGAIILDIYILMKTLIRKSNLHYVSAM